MIHSLEMSETGGTRVLIWSLWSIRSVWSVRSIWCFWLNETNQMNQIDWIDQPCLRFVIRSLRA